jgi:hypothetical protein
VGTPPLLFSDKFIWGSLHIQVTLPTNELPCSYITVTLYNISITLLDRVTALCEARPLDASRHPFQPGPLQATHHGLLKPYKMNTGGTYALSLQVGAP